MAHPSGHMMTGHNSHIIFFGVGGLAKTKTTFNHGTYVSRSSMMSGEHVRPISKNGILTHFESSNLSTI